MIDLHGQLCCLSMVLAVAIVVLIFFYDAFLVYCTYSSTDSVLIILYCLPIGRITYTDRTVIVSVDLQTGYQLNLQLQYSYGKCR